MPESVDIQTLPPVVRELVEAAQELFEARYRDSEHWRRLELALEDFKTAEALRG